MIHWLHRSHTNPILHYIHFGDPARMIQHKSVSLYTKVAIDIDQNKIRSNLYFEHNINHINHWKTKVAFIHHVIISQGTPTADISLSLYHLVLLSYPETRNIQIVTLPEIASLQYFPDVGTLQTKEAAAFTSPYIIFISGTG